MVARGRYRHIVLTVADVMARQGLEWRKSGLARGPRFFWGSLALVTGRRVVDGARAGAVLFEA